MTNFNWDTRPRYSLRSGTVIRNQDLSMIPLSKHAPDGTGSRKTCIVSYEYQKMQRN